ncbi:MAG: TerB family tellurite resistance protein [Flavobacteriaceae bacterium]|nr:TerB family tellurite resistance protein [Flavobacteriaceae bacterium]
MSYSDLYTPRFKSRNRDHFAAIVRIALADGVISEEEKAFIDRLAIHLEIEDEEKASILENSNQHPINPPTTKQGRLERFYDLARMVLADHIADEAEKQLMKRMVVGLGFPTDQIEPLIDKAFTLIKDGSDQDDFVAAFD